VACLQDVRCDGSFAGPHAAQRFLDRLPPWLTSLELDHCNLSGVAPTAFNHLTALCSLHVGRVVRDMHDATLVELAGGASSAHLSHLALPTRELTHLPQQLSRLAGLRSLRLFGGDLGQQSSSQRLSALTRLTCLELSCGLTAVPAAVSSLTALQQLSLASNYYLGEQPVSFGYLEPLEQLTRLDLDACGLAEIPDALTTLTTLRHLSLCWNDGCVGGTQRLAALTRLTCLVLEGCLLREVPAALAACTALQQLDLGSNRLSDSVSLGQALDPLRQLTMLSLQGCPVQQLPAAVSTLTALRSLDLSLTLNNVGNVRLQLGGLEHLAPLCHLEELGLRERCLTELPAAVGSLTALRSLDLGSNPIAEEASLQQLLALGQLTALTLTWCPLCPLPAALGMLSSLEQLRLAGDQRPHSESEHGPDPLRPLQQLRSLTSLSFGHWFTPDIPGYTPTCDLAPLLPALSTLTCLRELTLCGPLVEHGWHHLEALPHLCHVAVLGHRRLRPPLPPGLARLAERGVSVSTEQMPL